MARVELVVEATDGAARAGTATTARGTYRTPCFMPVGTRGAVKYLSAADYDQLGAEIVLANTYHLMLRPGAEIVAALGGLRGFTGWDGLHPHRLGWLPGLLARPRRRRRRRDVPLHLRRLAPPPHARARRGHAGAPRRRHPDGARRLPGAPGAAGGGAAGGRAHGGVGQAGQRGRTPGPTRRCSASCRAASTSSCGARAPAAPSTSTSTATASAGCRSASPATRCCRRWPPRSPSCRPTSRAT